MWLGPDGLLQAILVLVAVAGAQDRAVLAIDEMENFLHPHAIRSVLRSVRALADERHLTVI
ncbi:MAG: ATP-binding protein [Polyangiaceae bacterium]|nr:ATP-binding protein [Polyangiaceae bacterium]